MLSITLITVLKNEDELIKLEDEAINKAKTILNNIKGV